MTLLKTHKYIFLIGGLLLLGFVLLFSQRNTGITIENPSAQDIIARNTSKGLLSGLLGNAPPDPSGDSARGLFLDEREVPSEERSEVILYINQANQSIPLTIDALRFALTEAILDQYAPLTDAVSRLQEGESALRQMKPPLTAIAFHEASIKLLAEYQRILRIPLIVSRQDFDPAQLEDDFEKLRALVIVAKNELRNLTSLYAVPLLPKVISFYEDAIGITR